MCDVLCAMCDVRRATCHVRVAPGSQHVAREKLRRAFFLALVVVRRPSKRFATAVFILLDRESGEIPGTRAVSFVQREGSGEFWVKQIEVATRKIEPLVKAVEGSTDRDMTWTPDGQTVLMSTGTKVFSWTRSAAGWTEVFDAAAHALGAVSRLAVSPKGDAVAIVVAEPQKQAFRSSRPRSGTHR